MDTPHKNTLRNFKEQIYDDDCNLNSLTYQKGNGSKRFKQDQIRAVMEEHGHYSYNETSDQNAPMPFRLNLSSENESKQNLKNNKLNSDLSDYNKFSSSSRMEETKQFDRIKTTKR